MKNFSLIAIAFLFAIGASAQRCDGIQNWDTTTTYQAGDFVQINGLLYQAVHDNFCRNPCYPDAAWDPNPWVLINTCDVDCSDAQVYNDQTEYGKDSIVKHDGYLYIALWGGNRGNRPDLNSGDWGAWKKLLKCQVCVTIEHDCASVAFSTGTLDDQGRVCVEPGTEVTFTATAQTDAVARVIGSDTQVIVVNADITVTFDCEYEVYVTLDGDCVHDPVNGVYPFWPSDHSNFAVNVQAPTLPDRECRINSIAIDGNLVAAAELTDIQVDHTIVTDCECQVCTDISGDCVLTPEAGHHCFYETDGVGLTITVEAPTRDDRECRINSITLDGNDATSPIVILLGDHVVETDCECQVCVDISGDCVNSPDSRTCAYATDAERLEVTVEAPEQEGYICEIDSILVDGVEVAEVVFDPLDADHTVVTDCSCRPICPHFYGCDNTPLYNNAQSQVYNGCDCVKQIFDCPNGLGTAIVFCAPEGATIRCDQNIYDGHLIWQGHAICVGQIVDYVAGNAYSGGDIVNKDGNCYVAKWWSNSDPSTEFGLYQSWRYIGVCAELL